MIRKILIILLQKRVCFIENLKIEAKVINYTSFKKIAVWGKFKAT